MKQGKKRGLRECCGVAQRLLSARFAALVSPPPPSRRTQPSNPQALRTGGDVLQSLAESEGRTATLDELSRPAIREWLAVLGEAHEPGTVKLRYRGLHRFCAWLVDEDELSSHPMKTLAPPTLQMKPVPLVSDEELAALLKACAGKDFNDRRDEALIRFLLDCGVRISEACAFRVDQLDLDQGMAIVKGKAPRSARSTSAPVPHERLTGMCGRGPSTVGRTLTHCSSPNAAHCHPMALGSASGFAARWPALTVCTRTGSGTHSPTTS